MALILSIETSTKVCSASVHNDGIVMAHHELHNEKSHSTFLTVIINELLRQTSVKISEIDAFAVSKGPGSYTGLRIGVSTAKGFCYSLDKPLIAVNTLEAMAVELNNINLDQSWICPMIDARRMEVYCMMVDQENKTIKPTSAEVIDHSSFAEILENHKVIFAGNGAQKCSEIITHPNARFLNDIYPSAKGIGVIANQYFSLGKFENVAYFEPYYLKEFMSKPTH